MHYKNENNKNIKLPNNNKKRSMFNDHVHLLYEMQLPISYI